MGRYQIELDPAGYQYAEEPGFHWFITGRDLLRKWIPDPKSPKQFTHNFLNPEGSEWLMCRPRQFNPLWYQDARMADHVMRKSLWTFGSGVTCVEWEPTRLPDGTTYPDNQWMSIQCPASITSLHSTDFVALATAAGTELPSGIGVVATAHLTPVGVSFAGELGHGMEYHPMLQLGTLPPPQDRVVFGFGRFALVLTHDSLIVCRTPDDTRTTWERLAAWPLTSVTTRSTAPAAGFGSGNAGLFEATEFRMQARSIKVLPVGDSDVYFYLNSNPPEHIRLTDRATKGFFGPGDWWYAAGPNQRVLTQAQVIGYESASTEAVPGPINDPCQVLFDMGALYKPTVKPKAHVASLLWTELTDPQFSVTGDGIDTPYSATATLTGTATQWHLYDETGAGFPYDGTRHQGGLRLELIPSTTPLTDGAYLSPMFRVLELKFPVKLVDRVCTPLTLDDTEFRGFTVEASLREPGGKRISIDLKQSGLTAFYASPLSEREGFPVHIKEDTDGDGTYATVRARGWIESPDIEDLAVPNDDGTGKITVYRLRGRGLLSRCARKPRYLPQIVNPEDPGYVEHTYAVGEVLLQCGFNTTEPIDPEVAVLFPDPQTGTRSARLPGTWGLTSGQVGTRVDSPWAPDWDEEYLQYLEALAVKFAGWCLYEDRAGVIHYHPNLMLDLLDGAQYFRSGTIYRTRAQALAAGVPGQYYGPSVRHVIEPPAGNCVRVTGKDPGNSLLPQYIEQDTRSLTDPDYESFVGEPLVIAEVNKLGVDEESLRRLCRVLLATSRRRLHHRSVTIPGLAPHELSGDGPIGLGYVAQFQGYDRDYLITHEEWELVTSRANSAQDYHITRLTGERLPAQDRAEGAVTAGNAAGGYPGLGITSESE